jgi:hypothetical protein
MSVSTPMRTALSDTWACAAVVVAAATASVAASVIGERFISVSCR